MSQPAAPLERRFSALIAKIEEGNCVLVLGPRIAAPNAVTGADAGADVPIDTYLASRLREDLDDARSDAADLRSAIARYQRERSPSACRSLIQELAARGKVVLFSSHELETVERICSHVVILHRGKVVADDSIEHLRTLMAAPTLEAIFSQLAVEQDTAAISREIADLIQA